MISYLYYISRHRSSNCHTILATDKQGKSSLSTRLPYYLGYTELVGMEVHNTDTGTNISKPSSDVLQYLNVNIGHQRIIEVLFYEGKSYIEILTFEKSPTGNYSKISSKSLRIPLISLKVIYDNLDTIKEKFETAKSGSEIQYRLHLGSLLMLRLDRNIKCVDFRKHYLQPNAIPLQENILPGIPGIGLKFCEFENLLKNLDQLGEITKISTITSCRDREDHLSGDVLENCKACNPHKIFF